MPCCLSSSVAFLYIWAAVSSVGQEGDEKSWLISSFLLPNIAGGS